MITEYGVPVPKRLLHKLADKRFDMLMTENGAFPILGSPNRLPVTDTLKEALIMFEKALNAFLSRKLPIAPQIFGMEYLEIVASGDSKP